MHNYWIMVTTFWLLLFSLKFFIDNKPAHGLHSSGAQPSTLHPHMPLGGNQARWRKACKVFRPIIWSILLCNSSKISSLEYLLGYGHFRSSWSHHCVLALLVSVKVAIYGPQVTSFRGELRQSAGCQATENPFCKDHELFPRVLFCFG